MLVLCDCSRREHQDQRDLHGDDAVIQCTRTWIGRYVLVVLSARKRTETKRDPSVPTAAVGVTACQNGCPRIGCACASESGSKRNTICTPPGILIRRTPVES